MEKEKIDQNPQKKLTGRQKLEEYRLKLRKSREQKPKQELKQDGDQKKIDSGQCKIDLGVSLKKNQKDKIVQKENEQKHSDSEAIRESRRGRSRGGRKPILPQQNQAGGEIKQETQAKTKNIIKMAVKKMIKYKFELSQKIIYTSGWNYDNKSAIQSVLNKSGVDVTHGAKYQNGFYTQLELKTIIKTLPNHKVRKQKKFAGKLCFVSKRFAEKAMENRIKIMRKANLTKFQYFRLKKIPILEDQEKESQKSQEKQSKDEKLCIGQKQKQIEKDFDKQPIKTKKLEDYQQEYQRQQRQKEQKDFQQREKENEKEKSDSSKKSSSKSKKIEKKKK